MKQLIFLGAAALCALQTSQDVLAQDDIAALRAELEQMKADYEARLSELERQLEIAQNRIEAAVADAAAPAALPATTTARAAAGTTTNAFNPALSVIFESQAWAYDHDPEGYFIPGFPLAGETGPAPEGFSLGETEIDISANVDDKFTAWLTVPVAVEEGEAGIEIEEAWIETLSLPAGLSARFGRMFSDIGYLNEKHAHSWDFTDQPLPYKAFLGNQYIDDGARLSWIAPTLVFLELSGEILRGDRYPFTGAANSGFGAYTARTRLGGDIGLSHSWQASISWLEGESSAREAGDEEEPLLFDGDTEIWIADFVWKWAPQGNWRARNFKFQFEYLERSERGVYLLPNGVELPWDADEEGWYAQAIYQFLPQWRVGMRYDTLASDDPGPAFVGTALARGNDDPSRYSLMADWSNSEFSRVRAQYTRDEAGEIDDNQFGLQYILSIGAHGAHSF